MLVRNVYKNEKGLRTWSFGHSYSDYKKGQSSVEQDIESALYEWENDAFWALQNGINWKLRLGAHNQKELLDADILKVIQARNDVISIYDVNSSLIERNYTLTCSVYTIYSEDPIVFNFLQNLE